MIFTNRPGLHIIFVALAALALFFTCAPWVEAQDGPVPAQPTGLSTAPTHNSVTLTWDNPGDDSITHYQVLRRDHDVHDTGEFVTIEVQHRLGGDELHRHQRAAAEALRLQGEGRQRPRRQQVVEVRQGQHTGGSRGRTNGRAHGRTNGRAHGRTHSRAHGRTHSRAHGRTHSRADGRTHSRADGRTHSRADGRTHSRADGRNPQSCRRRSPQPRRRRSRRRKLSLHSRSNP